MVGCRNVTQTGHTDVAASTQGAMFPYTSGGKGVKVLFIKKFAKSSSISNVPVNHPQQGPTPAFGVNKVSWKVARSGDYLISSWIRCELSSVTMADSLVNNGVYLRWSHNLAHGLFSNIDLAFTNSCAFNMETTYLDFFAAFSVPASKRNAYDNMIGNDPALVNPIYNCATVAAGNDADAQVLPSAVLILPLPMPYSPTTTFGCALPVGALIYNEVSVNVDIRPWQDLLLVSNVLPIANALGGFTGAYGFGNTSRPATIADVVSAPTLTCDLWGTYGIVSPAERATIAKMDRDLIWVTPQHTAFQGVSGTEALTQLRFSYVIKAVYHGIRNTTAGSELSNYTTREAFCYSPHLAVATAADGGVSATEFPAPNAFDPVATVDLTYEGISRLSGMTADYCALVQPYFHAAAVPSVTGYHVYSYALSLDSTDYTGGVDMSKLTGVVLTSTLSTDCLAAMAGSAVTPFFDESGAACALPAGYVTAFNGGAISNSVGIDAVAQLNAAAGFNRKPQTFQHFAVGMAHAIFRITRNSVRIIS